MALFEPTNITPDQKYSAANGTVDASNGLDIAWQVNGNSMTPMTGYNIKITENDAQNTFVYMTPIERLGTPFIGADALGNPIRYQIHLPKSDIQSGHYFGYSGNTLSDVAVDFSVFTSALTEYNLYQFTFLGVGRGWRFLGGIESSLAPYGITYTGTPQVGDTISVIVGAPIVNGKEYKMSITQFWAGGAVSQKSPSVFVTRAAPKLLLGSFPQPLDSRTHTFTAAYSQLQGDALTWVRWRVAPSDDLENPLYDSGRIYGAGSLETTYDGFFSGSIYAVRCNGETVNGVAADTGWTVFSVDYTMYPTTARLSAVCGRRGAAARLTWDGLLYLPGYLSGGTLEDNTLVLPNASSFARWGGKLSGAPWSLIYRGAGISAGGAVYNDILRVNGFSVGDILICRYGDKITIATVRDNEGDPTDVASGAGTLAPIAVYIRPSETAEYPANQYVQVSVTALLTQDPPREATICSAFIKGTQATNSSIVVSGTQECRFVQTFDNVENNALTQWLAGGGKITEYDASRDAATVMMTQWHLGRNTLSAGTVDTDPNTGTMTIYREKDGALTRVAQPKMSAKGIFDYAVGNQQGPFTYYAFPSSSDNWNAPMISAPISPCCWDWVLLSCIRQEDGGYVAEAAYYFGKNLTTGAVSNNNAPSLWKNFTRYPTLQRAPQNYQSGSLTALIGVVENGEYADTLAARNAIMALSVTENTLFLKSRKGDVLQVAISGAISMQTGDNTPQQTQTATIPWAEIGSADGAQIYGIVE